MVDCEDYVSLSDDDTIAEVATTSVVADTKNTNSAGDKIETIVIDEEDSEYNNVIDLSDSQNSTKNEALNPISKIFAEECKMFAVFVEKCLSLENSDGMIRIIKRNVRSAFEECDKTYRRTSKFKKFIKKTIKSLEQDPHHKFSYIKVMVEKLKRHKKKKRVQLTTLATHLNDNSSQQKNDNTKSLKESNNSIVLDSDDEPKEVPTINLEDDQAEVICLDEAGCSEEKENHVENGKPNSQESYLLPHKERVWEPSNSQEFSARETEQQILPIEYVPQQTLDIQKVKRIEAAIAGCKKKIAILEEAEVLDDSPTSPYILCESYKAQIVNLYKQLCMLTGKPAIKRRKVRLNVLEGHPAGPVKLLEKFINENIGEDGTPSFPDFCDVVKCVMVANIEDKLSWSKQQVMKEATSLFTQCGRALQKKRQRREYRDLLSRVKTEELDPADDDPELMMKLELNQRIAIKKEHDLLEKYTMLQDLPSKPKPGPRALQDPTTTPETVTHYHDASSSQQIYDNQSISYSYSHVKRLENPITSVVNSNFQTSRTYTHVNRIGNTPISNMSNLQQYQNVLVVSPMCNTRGINTNIVFEDTIPHNSIAFATEAPLTNENVNNNKETAVNNDQNEQSKPITNNDALSEEDSDFEPPEVPLSQEIRVSPDKTDCPESDVNKFRCVVAPICDKRGINTNIVFEDTIPHNSIAFVKEAPSTNENVNNNKGTAVNNDQNEQPKPSTNNDALSEEDSDFEPPEVPLSQEIRVSPDKTDCPESDVNKFPCVVAPICDKRSINTNVVFQDTTHDSIAFLIKAALNNEIVNNNKDTAVDNDQNEQPQASSNNDVLSEEDSDFEPPEVPLFQEMKVTDKTDCPESVNKGIDGEVKIKQEQIDIVKMLEELGDDYTVSVFDIHEPTLVIEISSDSSDEEMQVDGEDDILEDENSLYDR